MPSQQLVCVHAYQYLRSRFTARTRILCRDLVLVGPIHIRGVQVCDAQLLGPAQKQPVSIVSMLGMDLYACAVLRIC